MNAVLNHTVIPFFDRVPTRGKEAVIATFDNIVEKAWTLKEAYKHFNNTLRSKSIVGPTWSEFEDWYARVKNGLIERPHPSEAIIAGSSVDRKVEPLVFKQPLAVACTVETVEPDLTRLKHAKSIVLAAYHLFNAKIAAGYSPLSVSLDDTIVAEALKEILEAEAVSSVMDADTHVTPGNKLVDLLLGTGDDDIDAKIVDCLAIDMQQEICRELVRNRVVIDSHDTENITRPQA